MAKRMDALGISRDISALRFGHRWSVIGKVNATLVEFGFEDWSGAASDMDFNDIIFTVENLKIIVFRDAAVKRTYLW